jgi:hypothetical protein
MPPGGYARQLPVLLLTRGIITFTEDNNFDGSISNKLSQVIKKI